MPLPQDMLAIDIARPGGPEVLTPVRVPLPTLRPGEVLVRVAAAGVNYPDLLQRMGYYDPPSWHSPRPGLEVSGEIAALGEGVGGRTIGERVLALCNGGGYAEFVAIPAGQALPVPAGVDMTWAGAIAETWFTVQQTLVERAGLAAGMSVLVHGAAGGIGTAALSLALIHGARPIAVVSTQEKADYLASTFGIPDIIIHTRENFAERARQLTGGKGVDRIVTFAGGETLSRNFEAAARGAVIVQLAALSDSHASIALPQLLGKQLTLFGSTLRPQPDAIKAAIGAGLVASAWPAFAAGKAARPHLATLPMAAAEEAHRRLETRNTLGKLVLLTAFGQSFVNDNSVAER